MKVSIEKGDTLEVAITDGDKVVGSLSLTLRGLGDTGARRGRKPGPKPAAEKAGGKRRKRRQLSPEARAKMAEAQRRRWAKAKGGGEGSAA